MSKVSSQIIQMERKKVKKIGQNHSYPEYFEDYNDNLIEPMARQHILEYGRGRGPELLKKGALPAKMASIRSSSAMTFNLLGNCSLKMIQNPYFMQGTYDIAYEKQLFTLKNSNAPANLDAYLVRRTTQDSHKTEAVFCEMKMMEWLENKPGLLSNAYCQDKHYFSGGIDRSAYQVFQNLIDLMTDHMNAKGKRISIFKRYDAWQMFKHILGIYNHTSSKTQCLLAKKIQRLKDKESYEPELLQGKLNKITLVNVVFEMPAQQIDGKENQDKYAEALLQEHEEAKAFRRIMLDNKNGLKQLFKMDCGIDFELLYLSVPEFLKCIDKTPQELSYLKRYTF